MISALLCSSGRSITRSQPIARTTPPGSISPPEPTLIQAGNSRRPCTCFYADWNVARHNLELFLQDGADHKQLNLASKGIVLSAAFMDEQIRKLTEQGPLRLTDRSKAHPAREGSESN